MFDEKMMFTLRIDSISRVLIRVINRADSCQIAEIGNLTHDAVRGGFYSGDGRVSVSADVSYVRCLQTLNVPNTNLPTIRTNPLPQPIERLYEADPATIPPLVTYMTGQRDIVYLSRSMRLDRIDFDRIRNGRFIRSFADDVIWFQLADFLLPFYDHLGNFIRMFILYRSVVFEQKCFKFVDRPGEWPLLFKPEHPGVWFPWGVPDGGTVMLDTDAVAVINRTSAANAWLCDAGNLAELDAEIFRYKQVYFLWHSRSLQGREQFASALRFLAEMKKHGIMVEIMDAETGISLDQDTVLRQSCRYHLSVPECLKEKSFYLSATSGSGFVPGTVPLFWPNGSSTLFFGPGQKAILEKLLLSFSGEFKNGFPRKNAAVLLPDQAETRARKLQQKTGVQIPFIRQSILHTEDGLDSLLCQGTIDVLFLICADEFKEKELVQVLDLCERRNVMAAVFSQGQDTLNDIDEELLAQTYLTVAQGENIIIKDMTTEKINKYLFCPGRHTEVLPSSEEEINKLIHGGSK